MFTGTSTYIACLLEKGVEFKFRCNNQKCYARIHWLMLSETERLVERMIDQEHDRAPGQSRATESALLIVIECASSQATN